jgi:16S rRNA processing protein RimM
LAQEVWQEKRVAIVKSPRGLKGEVKVVVTTDEPKLRFEVGNTLQTSSQCFPTLTVERYNSDGRAQYLKFAEVSNRNDAEELFDAELYAKIDVAEAEKSGEYYYSRLVGLDVKFNTEIVGVIEDVIEYPAQLLLKLRLNAGGEALVPFVEAIVPVVDTASGFVEITPPPGLLEEM